MVDNVQVAYELIGDRGRPWVITPGGRFSKDFPGVHELADALASGGQRVLLWDRPNCGRSDVQLFGRSESHMRAEVLGHLVQQLGIDRLCVAGGSGGARDSIVFTIMWPQLVRKLAVWSIVGGTYSTMSLAAVYILNELRTVRQSGIDGILTLTGPAGSFGEMVEANPRNADRLRSLGAEEFESVMTRWLDAFVPKPNEAIPGVADWEFATIDAPTLIIRGGAKDHDHPRRTSLEVHALITGSRLIEPPWPEDAWEASQKARDDGRGNIFDPWVQAAPALLEFFGS